MVGWTIDDSVIMESLSAVFSASSGSLIVTVLISVSVVLLVEGGFGIR